jgi:hypothetical protein
MDIIPDPPIDGMPLADIIVAPPVVSEAPPVELPLPPAFVAPVELPRALFPATAAVPPLDEAVADEPPIEALPPVAAPPAACLPPVVPIGAPPLTLRADPLEAPLSLFFPPQATAMVVSPTANRNFFMIKPPANALSRSQRCTRWLNPTCHSQ